MFTKIINNWNNGKLDISDMGVVVVFLGILGSVVSGFNGSVSYKAHAKRKKTKKG